MSILVQIDRLLNPSTLQLRRNVNMHSLDIRICRKTSLSQLPSNTTLLDSTEWNPPVAIITRVNPNHTSFNPLRYLMRPRQVCSKQGTAETILSIVG